MSNNQRLTKLKRPRIGTRRGHYLTINNRVRNAMRDINALPADQLQTVAPMFAAIGKPYYKGTLSDLYRAIGETKKADQRDIDLWTESQFIEEPVDNPVKLFAFVRKPGGGYHYEMV